MLFGTDNPLAHSVESLLFALYKSCRSDNFVLVALNNREAKWKHRLLELSNSIILKCYLGPKLKSTQIDQLNFTLHFLQLRYKLDKCVKIVKTKLKKLQK